MPLVENKTTLDKKIERFRAILEGTPDNSLAALALAEASFRRGLRLEALTAYQDVLREHPVAEAHLAIAQIYSGQGMVAEAFEELETLLDLDADNVEARVLFEDLCQIQEPPDSLAEKAHTPPRSASVRITRRRLLIQKSIINRELQELTRNATLSPSEPIHEYYVEETKKRLLRLTDLLVRIDEIEEKARKFELAPPVPSPDLMGAEAVTIDIDTAAGVDLDIEMAAPSDEQASSSPIAIDPPAEFEELPAAFAAEDPMALDDMFLAEDPAALSGLPPLATDDYAELPPVLAPIGDDEPAPSLELDLGVPSAEEEAAPTEELPPPSLDVAAPAEFEEPVTEPAVEEEPELSAPESIEVAEEPEPEPVPPEEDSEARTQFYEQVAPKLSELTATLSKTRGVTSIYLASRRGKILEHSSRDEISPERIAETVVEALDFLESFADNPQYWVLECNGGIFVMQSVDDNHVLVAIGQAGANFGALRYTMDKTRSKFADILTGLPD